tara:strand:- start:43546 stop:44514 length:969 start_codon:yes stop_codon:yes gene_type:complete
LARLFTFGCSFSLVDWPTWATILCYDTDYDKAENWGLPGIGNLGIAQRLAECHSKNKFTKDDTIIVQWSSHLRNDYHLFKKTSKTWIDSGLPEKNKESAWLTKGSMFNMHNTSIYNRVWLDHFFSEQTYVMYSLNAITLAQALLKSVGCTWFMTSIGDFQKLGADFLNFNGDGESTDAEGNLLERYPEFEHYVNMIWNDNKEYWLKPIGNHVWEGQKLGKEQFLTDSNRVYKFGNTNASTKKQQPYWWDPHPSTDGAASWLLEILLPALKKNIKFNDKQSSIIKGINSIYKSVPDIDLFTFREQVRNYCFENDINLMETTGY